MDCNAFDSPEPISSSNPQASSFLTLFKQILLTVSVNTMLARFFAVASLAALAVATPLSLRDGQCNTGSIQCCQHSTSVSSEFLFDSLTGAHHHVDF
jgi:hypothetical protein